MGAECEDAIDKLKALQSHLGALQDAVVASERLTRVLTWGTWNVPTSQHQRWNTAPINAPDLATYLEFQQAEVQRLIHAFPEKWGYYESEEFQQLITSAVEALTSKN